MTVRELAGAIGNEVPPRLRSKSADSCFVTAEKEGGSTHKSSARRTDRLISCESSYAAQSQNQVAAKEWGLECNSVARLSATNKSPPNRGFLKASVVVPRDDFAV